MQLQFVGKNIDVTPALKSFTTEKMKSLEKRFTNITSVNVVFHVEHNSHVAEATVHMDGTEIHAHAQDDDMYKAINLVVDKLLGQMTKHKEKIIDSHR
ncbi:Ribosome hibernation promoting factor [Aquicella siphonis]|uniref:Ribosome hibernation promoting factor n=1 Tax=Aquicella siphonis TaxID=254247 RepID=A0A5E4PHQ0_9COXI|nr:ribosome-associated translation inhibitor RaiA [Aquicella siphonis]VVC76125.1 Ribosome hibernation promoting factor [Aquicella siphonis]